MVQYNRDELLRSIQFYRQSLEQIETLIEQNQWDDLETLLSQTHQARTNFVD